MVAVYTGCMSHPFEQLLARDPLYVQRHELVAAGVPAHTVESLYPDRGFNDFLPLFTSRLREIGIEHLSDEGLRIKELRFYVTDHLIRNAPKALKQQWSVDVAAWDQLCPEVDEFYDLLRPVLSAEAQSVRTVPGNLVALNSEAYSSHLLHLTHHCWWAMGNEAQLTEYLREKSGELATFIVCDLLLLPRASAAA